MTIPPKSVAIDARMLGFSGIGTVIRGLLHAWEKSPPPFEPVVLIRPVDEYHPSLPSGMRRVEYCSPIYKAGGLWPPAPIGDVDAVLGTHYTAPLLPRRPLVCIVHDLIHITHPDGMEKSAYMKARLAMLRKRAKYIITPSRHTKVQLQTLHRFPAHRVLTLPWGPGVAGFVEKGEMPSGLLPDGPFLLAVGILKRHKNWEFLLERLASLYKSGSLELPLVAAGLRNADKRQIKEIAKSAGIEHKVTYASHLTDEQMVGLYERASALLFPSLVEGFGFPIVESLACGTPVIAADLPPMNEFPPDGMALFDPDDPESFDNAILGVLNSEEARSRAKEGREALLESYSWQRLATRIEDVLLRLNGV